MDTTHHTSPKRPGLQLRVLGLALAAGLLTACGGSDDGGDRTGPGAAVGTTTGAPTAPSDAGTSGTGAEQDGGTASGSAEASETGEASESGETSSGSTSTGDAADEDAEEVEIVIADFSYETPDSVQPGAQITVRNDDGVGHTVTSSDDDGATFDVVVGPGETVTFTAPEEAGEFPYFCRPHPNMTDVLVVEEG